MITLSNYICLMKWRCNRGANGCNIAIDTYYYGGLIEVPFENDIQSCW